MSVNGLVHILGWGDFQMKQIDSKTDPYPLNPLSERQKVCNEKIENDVLIMITSLNFLMTQSKKGIGHFVVLWLKPY